MDLLKRLPLDEKFHHPTMERLVGLFRVSKGGVSCMHSVLYA